MLQEFKKMPLRLSRQLLLDQWNEAIAYMSSVLDARLAGGNMHAGVRLRHRAGPLGVHEMGV